MFGIYPAGYQWTRLISSKRPASEIACVLRDKAGFTGHELHEPFGQYRGAVFASHQGFLVMVEADTSDTDLVVVPDVQLQNLLWSFNNGYSTQWSDREIKILTGLASWDDLLVDVAKRFRWTCSMVEQAVAGTLEKAPDPTKSDSASSEIDEYDSESWVLVNDYGIDGSESCAL